MNEKPVSLDDFRMAIEHSAREFGMYVVFDLKSKSYDVPFFALSDEMAKRRFVLDCRGVGVEDRSVIHQFKEDFELLKLGKFNPGSGVVDVGVPDVIFKGTEV